MADLGNQKIKDTYQLVLQTDSSGNLQKLDGSTPNPFIVNGNLRYLDGTSHPSGYVLISDGSGNASWGAVAFSGDVYISGGSIDDTVITLQTTSGNTISIPGLAWSAGTDGSVSPSGATTDVRISGNTYSNNIVLKANAGGTNFGQITPDVNHGTIKFMTKPPGTADNGESLTISQDLIEAKASPNTGTLVSYMKLQPVDGGQDIISFNDGNNDIDFAIKSDNQIAFKLDAANDMMAFRDYVGIGYSADKWPTSTGGLGGTPTYQLRVAGQTLLSGITTPLEVIGNISGTTNLYIDDNMYSGTTNLLDIFASSAITNQDVYWSANTDGSISPSGLTTTVQTEGDLRVSGTVYTNTITTTGASTDTLVIKSNQVDIKSDGGDVEYVSVRDDKLNFYLDSIEAVTFSKTNSYYYFNSAGQNYDFRIDGPTADNSLEVDVSANRTRLIHHLVVGRASDISSTLADSYGLAVTGSSLFYSGGTNTSNNAIEAFGDISGTTNLYLGDTINTASTITAPNKLTIKGASTTNDYLTLEDDYVQVFIDGASALWLANTPGDGQIILNASSKDMNTKILTNDQTNAVLVDAGLNLVRLHEHVSITPTGADISDYSRTLFVSGETQFEGNVEVSGSTYITGNTFYEGALSGTGSINTTKNLYVSGNTFIGGTKIDVADGLKIQTAGQEYPYIYFNGDTLEMVSDQGDTMLLGDNVSVNSSLLVADNIQHKDDVTNEISFASATQDFRTNNSSRLDISNSGVRLGGANSRVTTILDEDNMASDSNTSLATQQSIKAYVDSQVAGSDTLQEVTDNGATTTNAIQLGSNLGISGDTFYEGALSGTGNITTTANITATGNLTTTGGIRTNIDDFVVDVTNTPYKQVGVNTNVPDANLTISGNTGFTAYDMNGGTAQFSNGFTRVLFASGADTNGLEVGDTLVVTDGSGTDRIIEIATISDSTNIFLAANFPGTSVVADGFTYNGLEPTPFRVYNQTTLAFEVDGNNTFYGGAFSGTGNITTTGNLFVSGDTFYEGAFSGTGDIITVGNLGGSNITASNDLFVTGDTFYEGALSGTGSITTTEDIGGTNITASNNLYITGNTFYEGALSGTGDLQISDAGKLKLGDAGDLEIYHDGNNSYIDDAGTGTIFYRSGTQTFQNAAASKTMATFNAANSVDLRYNNSLKFETTNTGILVTGDGKADTLTSTSNLYVTGNTFYEGALSGTGSITTTDKVFISGDTYAPNFQNGTTIIQCSFSLKTFSTNNWASHPVSQGGLNSEFWTQDTGVSDLSGLYAYYNTASPTASNPSPSQGSFCAPATGKLRKIVFNGANATGAVKGDDLQIEIAKAPVTDGQSGLTYTQLSGITHTLPDNTAKRFIIDCAFGGEGVDVTANDVILVAFKTTESSNAFIRINLSAYFEYPLPLIT